MNQTIQWDSDHIQNQSQTRQTGVLRLPRFFAGTPSRLQRRTPFLPYAIVYIMEITIEIRNLV